MSRPNISYPTPIPGPSSYTPQQAPRPNLGLDPSPISRDTGGPSVSSSSMSSSTGGGGVIHPTRKTSSSTRSGGQYTSALDSSITRLLVTTKQLLQGLEQWSQRIISENDVSDIYVRLGNGFEICIQAFQRAGIPTQELDAIPQDLRACLEQCLSYDQNHETLEVYLPEIRQIIYNLLHGLKQKQAAYKRLVQDRQRDTPPIGSSSSHAQIAMPTPTPVSAPPPPQGPPPPPPVQSTARKPSRGETVPSDNEDRLSARSAASAPVSASASITSASPASITSQLPATKQPSSSALAERGARIGLPTRPAPPDAFRPPRMRAPEQSQPRRSASPSPATAPAPLPLAEPVRHQLVDNPVPSPSLSVNTNVSSGSKPPPRPDRFSRDSYGSQRPVSRFSADSDITNGSPIRSPPIRSPRKSISEQLPEEDESEEDAKSVLPPSLPVLNLPSALELSDDSNPLPKAPPPPSAPPPAAPPQFVDTPPDVPPETRATLAALQRSDALERRASKRFSSYTFNKMLPGSPGKKSGISSPQRPTRRADRPPPMPALPESLLSATKGGSLLEDPDAIPPTATTHLQANGEAPQFNARPSSPTVHVTSDDSSDRSVRVVKTPDPDDISSHATPRPRGSIASPASLSVFLQIGRQVKKANIDLPASMSNLRLLFMERFEYDPGMEDFPDVYIRDNKTGVQFELEEMEDLREGCVLSLNIEPLDQVKQHFDTTFASLMQEIKEMKKAMDASRRLSMTPSPSLLTVSPSLQMSRAPTIIRRPSTDTVAPSSTTTTAAPLPRVGSPSPGPASGSMISLGPEKERELKAQYEELQSLRRDLAIMRQIHVDFLNETKESFGKLRTQNSAMRDVVKTKMGGSRALLDNSKAKLEGQCQDTIQAVEEISDTIDAAREDAYKRFVTPSKAQMATIRSDLEKARKLVDQFASDVQLADPTWRATWQTELHRVMEEQKLLSYQLKLCSDLKNDIKDATEMLGNVQTFVDQRAAGASRVGSKTFRAPKEEEESEGGISNLLMEIRTKGADPDSRLKAIEAQQRMREKEKASKVDEFEQELKLGGKKLKKTGGTEEADRMRQRRQEVALRKMINGGDPSGAPGILSPQNTGASVARALSPQFTGPGSASSSGQRALSPQYTGGGGGTFNDGGALSPQMTGGSIAAALAPNLTGGGGGGGNANVRRGSSGGLSAHGEEPEEQEVVVKQERD
ncbi:hypothetical protein I317_01873 [Kwoniella heveanensis CBS 569]|nr:hypothetical protein I317_01873 [Kwoniella heveanensis CBS 569]